ncbi:MAG: methyltransferase [Verrucomicrobia bacterium]|nr:methyltransferase [Verrucomicrobiota bacterium]
MPSLTGYTLVRLPNGACSVHSLAHHETFHPVVGPVAEAEALYVRQLRLPERAGAETGEFVVWDIGLGAAANPVTVLRALRHWPGGVRIESFDHTLEPLRFALEHAGALGYLRGYETRLRSLLEAGETQFRDAALSVTWRVHLGDFPAWLAEPEREPVPKPHALLYDAYSPATNPAMWTAPLFGRLFGRLDPGRPCALATYSRSTLLRSTLLLAGFHVGAGHATGEKEETTIAANTPELIAEPLGRRWLGRARRSTSAEPLWEPLYRQARLSPESWERLRRHPQFSRSDTGC